MVRTGDRVKVCDLTADIDYGALATVRIAGGVEENEDGEWQNCQVQFDEGTCFKGSTDRITFWWMPSYQFEVIASAPSGASSMAEDEDFAIHTESVPAAPSLADELIRRLRSNTLRSSYGGSVTQAVQETSDAIRNQADTRRNEPVAWPDPGYERYQGWIVEDSPSEQEEACEQSSVESNELRESNEWNVRPT